MATIVIGGDVCPTDRDIEHFRLGNPLVVCDIIREALLGADVAVCNLECPLIDLESPIKKTGANFGCVPDVVHGLKAIGIGAVNLANNHILDHGPVGLAHTLRSLDSFGLRHFGAGENAEKASAPVRFAVGGLSVTFMSYAEHEFSVAGESTPGASPLDLMSFVRTIERLRESSDYIILLYHGGKEHYPLPTPKQQKLCRFFVDMGVSLVICQHSHIVGAVEDYEGGKILYGQGNFIFDPAPQKRMWLYEGVLVKVEISGKGVASTTLVPFIHRSSEGDGFGVRALHGQERERFFKGLEKISVAMALDDNHVTESWRTLCNELAPTYLTNFLGGGRYIRFLNKYIPLSRFLYREQSRLLLKNMLSCETHREIAEAVLESSIRD